MALDNEHQELHRIFDERLAAAAASIKEIVESVAFSLKIHADMIVSIDNGIERNNAAIEKLVAAQAETDARLNRLANLVEKVTKLARSHERRINKLEDGK